MIIEQCSGGGSGTGEGMRCRCHVDDVFDVATDGIVLVLSVG